MANQLIGEVWTGPRLKHTLYIPERPQLIPGGAAASGMMLPPGGLFLSPILAKKLASFSCALMKHIGKGGRINPAVTILADFLKARENVQFFSSKGSSVDKPLLRVGIDESTGSELLGYLKINM